MCTALPCASASHITPHTAQATFRRTLFRDQFHKTSNNSTRVHTRKQTSSRHFYSLETSLFEIHVFATTWLRTWRKDLDTAPKPILMLGFLFWKGASSNVTLQSHCMATDPGRCHSVCIGRGQQSHCLAGAALWALRSCPKALNLEKDANCRTLSP